MERPIGTLFAFAERLARDPALWDRVLADPLGTVRAEGVAVDARAVKSLLGIAGATDHELLAVIEVHLRRLFPAKAPTLLDACTEYLFPDGSPAERPRPPPACTGLPLGVQLEADLPPEQLAALDRLARFDLDPVRDYVAAEGNLPSLWLDDAILEFRRYLAIRRVFARTFAMFSEQVDEVWHAALLFTELYAGLCNQVFGELAHHDPWDEPKPAQVAVLWERFHAAYTRLFGEPSYLWTLRLPEGTHYPLPAAVPAGPAPVAGAIGD